MGCGCGCNNCGGLSDLARTYGLQGLGAERTVSTRAPIARTEPSAAAVVVTGGTPSRGTPPAPVAPPIAAPSRPTAPPRGVDPTSGTVTEIPPIVHTSDPPPRTIPGRPDSGIDRTGSGRPVETPPPPTGPIYYDGFPVGGQPGNPDDYAPFDGTIDNLPTAYAPTRINFSWKWVLIVGGAYLAYEEFGKKGRRR